MTRKLLFTSAMMAAFSVSGLAFAASSVSNITSTLEASPTVSEGKCPAVINFKGTITVKGNIDRQAPVQIGYQFLRSDNATGPITYYTVTAPGTQTVSATWTLGGPSLPTFAGWEQLKAWPTAHQGGFGYSFSEKANFKVVCAR